MPVSVVVGAQYGSEGKGKVALDVARTRHAVAAIRVGGPNSGHTVIDDWGNIVVFRQLPTAALLSDTLCLLPAGAYIDYQVLRKELDDHNLDASRVAIDPAATIITEQDKAEERSAGLTASISSTGSGVGAAVRRRVWREGDATLARDFHALNSFIRPTTPILRHILSSGGRVVLEGTQGFGLSVLGGTAYPYVTSRDTTAAGALSEAQLSPLDVDDIILVARALPIRVAGTSGPLENEIDWQTVAREGRLELGFHERTTVTQRVRRVARFHADVVRCAVDVNHPTTLVLNHLDYVPEADRSGFVKDVERQLDRRVDFVGLDRATVSPRDVLRMPSEHASAVAIHHESERIHAS